MAKTIYTAEAHVTGGREHGHGATSDGRLDVQLRPPTDGAEKGTNPEQLFAVGYSSCFHSALKLVAQRMKLDATDSTVTAKVGLGSIEGSPGFGLVVELAIAVPKIENRDEAQQLVDRSHKVCPYSNAINGNVDVTLTVV
jgi:lipoyl-dependent peroxiredoxin